jgi:hypothetical protein
MKTFVNAITHLLIVIIAKPALHSLARLSPNQHCILPHSIRQRGTSQTRAVFAGTIFANAAHASAAHAKNSVYVFLHKMALLFSFFEYFLRYAQFLRKRLYR